MLQGTRLSKTATGKDELIIGDEFESNQFAERAKRVIDYDGINSGDVICGLSEKMIIATLGEDQFCISWDIWFPELSIMAWQDTPDHAVLDLMDRPAHSDSSF